jgi:acyl-coenzyme A thioesterase PaaI-like protein
MNIVYDSDYQGCFVCGKQNLKGLQLDFLYDAEHDEMCTRCSFSPFRQGYERIVHGGFVSMLLDEVMAKACLQRELVAVTVQFEVRFRKPVYVSEEVSFRGRVLEVIGRRIKTEARCLGQGGEERATATALFLLSSPT